MLVRDESELRMNGRESRTLSRYHFLLAGALSGAIMHSVLFVWLWATTQFGYLGQESAKAQAIVEQHYLPDYLIFNLELFGYNLILGILAGLVSCFVISSFSPRPRWMSIAWLLLPLGCLNLLLVMRSIVQTPQLYWEVYTKRDFSSSLIDFVLDYATPLLIDSGLVVVFLLSIIGLKRLLGWRAVSLVCLVLVVASLWGVAPAKFTQSASKAPNVVLVIVDSLRTDRLSGLGYSRQTTPNIDELMLAADVFPNTYVSLPRTTPSVVSLLTGQLPMQHGVRTMFPSAEERRVQQAAMPRLLQKEGYSAAVVSDYAGEMFHDIDFGYHEVVAPSFNFPAIYRQRSLESQFLLLAWLNNFYGRQLLPELEVLPQNSDPEILTDKALQLAARLPQPFFLTVFYSATHFPYTATYPDYNAFVEKDYEGAYRFSVPYFNAGGIPPTDDDKVQINALYDGALRGVDRAVGRLLGTFKQNGLLEKSVVVMTADHGENLLELNSGLGHGDHFVGGVQSVRVPLLIHRSDSGEQKLMSKDVRSIDLLPTMVEILGVETAENLSLPGFSVYSDSDVPREIYVETGIWMSEQSTTPIKNQRITYPDILETAEVDFATGDEVVIKDQYRHLVNTAKHRLFKQGPWVLLYKPTRAGIRYELFRHDKDPFLTRDLSDEFPEKLQSLRTQLLELMASESGVDIRNDFVVYE